MQDFPRYNRPNQSFRLNTGHLSYHSYALRIPVPKNFIFVFKIESHASISTQIMLSPRWFICKSRCTLAETIIPNPIINESIEVPP